MKYLKTTPYTSVTQDDSPMRLPIAVWWSQQNLCENEGSVRGPCTANNTLYLGTPEGGLGRDDHAKMCPDHFIEEHIDDGEYRLFRKQSPVEPEEVVKYLEELATSVDTKTNS